MIKDQNPAYKELKNDEDDTEDLKSAQIEKS